MIESVVNSQATSHIGRRQEAGVMTSESLGGVMVSALAWNAIYVGSIPALGAMFAVFIMPQH